MLVGVAIRFEGKIWSLPKPNRHHDVIRMIYEQTGKQVNVDLEWDQGFVDENGKYYHRRAALVHAIQHKQLLERAMRHSRLYSEDVW